MIKKSGHLEMALLHFELPFVFLFCLLAGTSFAPFPLDTDTFTTDEKGTALYNGILLILSIGLTGFRIVLNGRQGPTTLMLWRHIAFTALVAMSVLSTIWSDFPSITLNRSITASVAALAVLF
jgi:hypothetical protein